MVMVTSWDFIMKSWDYHNDRSRFNYECNNSEVAQTPKSLSYAKTIITNLTSSSPERLTKVLKNINSLFLTHIFYLIISLQLRIPFSYILPNLTSFWFCFPFHCHFVLVSYFLVWLLSLNLNVMTFSAHQVRLVPNIIVLSVVWPVSISKSASKMFIFALPRYTIKY